MDLYLGPSWVMLKAVFLEVLCFPADLVAPLEVAKLVPPSEMIMIFWDTLILKIFILSLWKQWWQG